MRSVIVVHIHLRPVESSRHVKAEQKLEARLQLLCGLVAISDTIPLPIFASNIQCKSIAVDVVCPLCKTSQEFHGDSQAMRLCQKYI
jgi:hypothetical protein